MLNEEEIRKTYSENVEKYEGYSHEIERLLEKLLERNNIKYDHIKSRVKSLKNVIDKANRKNYKDPFLEMPDIVGIRIITQYKNEIEKIQQLIRKEFNIIEEINKASELDSDRFGYSDLHLVVKLSDKRSNLSEYNQYAELQAEIQIRTILQHAWDKLSRQIEYNTNIESPIPLRRKIFRLSALLEIADDEFINIKTSKDAIISEYKKEMAKDKFLIPIDYESIKIYFTKYFDVDNFNRKITEQIKNYKGTVHATPRIDTRYLDSFLFSLKKANFNTLRDLDKWIKKLETEKLRIELLPHLFESLKRGSYITFDIIHYLHFQLDAEFFKNKKDRVGMAWMEV